MTLHCNKVKLWPCPEWVAKMCMHEITEYIPNGEFIDGKPVSEEGRTFYYWALERYLIWFDQSKPLYVPGAMTNSEIREKMEIHKQEVLEAMKAPNLKVWME